MLIIQSADLPKLDYPMLYCNEVTENLVPP